MTRRDLLAHLLVEAGDRGLTTAELLQAGVGSRYSARLLELRELGWVIESERIRDGSWRYTLVRKPDVDRDASPRRDSAEGTPAQGTRGVPVDTGRLFELSFDEAIPPAKDGIRGEAA